MCFIEIVAICRVGETDVLEAGAMVAFGPAASGEAFSTSNMAEASRGEVSDICIEAMAKFN